MRYDYRCEQECGVFEVRQSITDNPLESCPTCGGPVTRLISGGLAIHFKGSGFYSTDYSSNGSSNGDAGASASAGGESSAGEGG